MDKQAKPGAAGVSDRMIRLVEIVFGVVLGSSLSLYRSVVSDPFSITHVTAVLALVTVYMTGVLSWIDWHNTMDRTPYLLGVRLEKIRFAADLLISTLYVYILFSIEALTDAPSGDLSHFLAGYVIVYALYIVSGVLRRKQYGRLASRPLIIAVPL